MRSYTIDGVSILHNFFLTRYDYMKKYCICQNNLKDKEEDAFIGLKDLFYT